MKYIIRSRQMGKTTEIAKQVLEQDGYLFTHSEWEKNRIIKKYPKLKNRVFSWHAYRPLPKCLVGRPIKPIFIDNADCWLRELTGGYECELAGASFNIDENIKNVKIDI